MATKYVDTDVADDNGTGDDWANAYQKIQTGLTQAGSNGVVYVQGAAVDTAEAARTLTAPAALIDGISIIRGCKDGTTNEPPQESDLCVRGPNTLPVWQVTGSGNDLGFDNYCDCRGIRFESPDRLQITVPTSGWFFHDCEFQWVDFLYNSSALAFFDHYNCGYEPSSTSATILARGASFNIVGGEFGGATVPTNILDNYNTTEQIFRGVDLSTLSGKTLFNSTNYQMANMTWVIGCELPATVTLETQGGVGPDQGVTFKECFSGTKGAGASSIQYHKTTLTGTVDEDATVVRTGGAVEDTTGAFSYALTPRIDSTRPNTLATVRSPWFGRRIAGDATTLQTFTVYITHSNADLNDDEAWLELYFPSEDGDASFDLDMTRHILGLASSNAIATDTSTWGGSETSKQKFVVAVTPDFVGTVFGRVHYAKHFASSPVVLYVDPFIEVT